METAAKPCTGCGYTTSHDKQVDLAASRLFECECDACGVISRHPEPDWTELHSWNDLWDLIGERWERSDIDGCPKPFVFRFWRGAYSTRRYEYNSGAQECAHCGTVMH